MRPNRSRDFVDKTDLATPIGPRSRTNSANPFDGLLRAHILGPNQKDNPVYESEGVPEHQLFHFPVVRPAPVGPGQERPTDFDLAFLLVVPVESRRPDDPAIFGISGDQCSTGFQGLAKEDLENFLLVTIPARMLFPNERVRGHRVQAVKIRRSKGPEFEKFAFQNGLEIKWHEGSGLDNRRANPCPSPRALPPGASIRLR